MLMSIMKIKNSERSDIERDRLIKHGKRIGFNGIIKQKNKKKGLIII